MSSAARPAFAAACAICSHTRSRFSAISAMQNCRAELALSASLMGASPANSFVSTSDALALQSTREHRDPIKVGRLLAENQQIPLSFAGKSLRNWAEHVTHETNKLPIMSSIFRI